MIDIAAKMRELIPLLKTQGVMGAPLLYVESECEEEWSPDYAIVGGVYDLNELEYFAPEFRNCEFYFHLEDLVVRHFSTPQELIVCGGLEERYKPGTIVVHVNLDSQEIEVYRQKE